MPTIGQPIFFFVDRARVFLRDGRAFFLAVFFEGIAFVSMNRNKS